MQPSSTTALRLPAVERDWSRASTAKGASQVVPHTIFGAVSGHGAGGVSGVASTTTHAGHIRVPPTLAQVLEQQPAAAAGSASAAAGRQYNAASAAAVQRRREEDMKLADEDGVPPSGGDAEDELISAGGGGYGAGAGAGAGADEPGTEDGTSGVHPNDSSVERLESVLSRNQVLPLRRENERLVKANNTLHQQLISEAEASDTKYKAVNEKHRKLQSEHKDLQFVYAQHTRSKRELEAELARCRRKMDSLLHDRATYQKEAIDAASLVARSDAVPPPPHPIGDGKSSAVQLVAVADARIAELERACARYAAAEQSWTDREANLLERLSHVNAENERLSHVVVTERNWDRIQCAHELEAQAATIKKLNQQIDFLNGERSQLGTRVGHLESVGGAKVSEALKRKDQDLNHLQHEFDRTLSLAEDLKSELKITTERWQSEVDAREQTQQQLKSVTASKDHELDVLKTTYNKVLTENDQLKQTLITVKAQLDEEKARDESAHVAVAEMRRALSTREKELAEVKQQFEALLLSSERVKTDYEQCKTEAEQSGRNLTEECQRLRGAISKQMAENVHLTGTVRTLMTAATAADAEKQKLLDRINLMSSSKLGADEEKKFLSEQLHDATELAKTEKQNSAALTTQVSELEGRIRTLTEEMNGVRAERQSVTDDLSQQTLLTRKTEAKLQSAHTALSEQKGVIAALEATVSQFKSEKRAIDEAGAAARKVQRDAAGTEAERVRLTKEVETLTQQLTAQTQAREALKQSMTTFDEKLLDIQSKVLALKEEKTQLLALNDELRSELKEQRSVETKLRTEITTHSQTISTLRSERVELAASVQQLDHQSGSRSDAAVRANQRVQELKSEKDALNSALEHANATIRDLKDQHTQTATELSVLQKQHATVSAQLSHLERSEQQTSVSSTAQKKQFEELKSVVRQVDATRERAEMQLQQNAREIAEWKSQVTTLQTERVGMEKKLLSQTEEIGQLRETLQSLDKERDKLQAQLDAKSEAVAKLSTSTTHEARAKEQVALSLEQHKRQLSVQHEQLNERDKKVSVLQKNIEHITIEYRKLEEVLRIRMTENKNLTDDLGNVMKANQVVNKKLQETVHDRDDRAQHLERALTQLAYAEQLLKAKAREQLDLQSTYQACCGENERLKASTRELDAERNEYRAVIRRVQEQCARLETYAQTVTQEKDRLIIDLQAMERKNVELQHALAAMSSTLDTSNSKKETLLKDVSTARSVTMGLQYNKDELNRKVLELAHSRELLEAKLNAMSTDNSTLIANLNVERTRYVELERVCQQIRTDARLREHTINEKYNSSSRAIAAHQLKINQLTAEKQTLSEAVSAMYRYRDKQTQEITRLTNMLAASVAVADPDPNGSQSSLGSGGSAASRIDRDKVLSALTHKISDLESQIREQQNAIQTLEGEKAKLKSFVWTYEAKVAQSAHDKKLAAAASGNGSPPNPPASASAVATSPTGGSAAAGGRVSPLAGAAAAAGTTTTTTTTTVLREQHVSSSSASLSASQNSKQNL